MSDKFNISLPKFPDYSAMNIQIKNPLHAETQYEIIMKSITSFEENLKDNEEVALKLACFGQTIILNVTHIGYSNPSLIHFYGYVEGQKATIIQHINQLSFMIMAVPVENPQSKPRRIGFQTDMGCSS